MHTFVSPSVMQKHFFPAVGTGPGMELGTCGYLFMAVDTIQFIDAP